MPKELAQLISKILQSSQLTEEEQEELQKELLSHFLDKITELELQGKSESQIIQLITQEFGDPQVLGEQLFLVHKRFEKIPWIGPLLYYVPARMGVRLLLTHLLLYLLGLAMVMLFLPHLFDVYPVDVAMLLERLLLGVFVLLTVLQGLLISQKVHTFGSFIETVFTSYLPLVCVAFFLLLVTGLAEDSDFSSLLRMLGWPLGIQLGGMLLSWAIGAYLYTHFHSNEQHKSS